MQPLSPPETHFLSAAAGWYELGNITEAKAELERISPALREHPDVLELRWLVHAQEKNWEQGLAVAEKLVEIAPERSSGWLHRAYALRRVQRGGLQTAWDALLPAFEKFPKEPTISYNLSCYACQMQQLEAARVWFKRAAIIGGKSRMKHMALDDPDLEALWGEIKTL